MRLTAPAFNCDQLKRKKSKEKNPTSWQVKYMVHEKNMKTIV